LILHNILPVAFGCNNFLVAHLAPLFGEERKSPCNAGFTIYTAGGAKLKSHLRGHYMWCMLSCGDRVESELASVPATDMTDVYSMVLYGDGVVSVWMFY